MSIPALILAAAALAFLGSMAGSAWDRGGAGPGEPAGAPMLNVRPINGWLEASYNARGLGTAVKYMDRCVATGPLSATCTMAVLYDTGGPFGDYRTVTLDVSCDDGRARAGDCVWSEL